MLDLGELTRSSMETQNIKREEVGVALMDMYNECGASEKALPAGISWDISKNCSYSFLGVR